jgi:hypothetical protein
MGNGDDADDDGETERRMGKWMLKPKEYMHMHGRQWKHPPKKKELNKISEQARSG